MRLYSRQVVPNGETNFMLEGGGSWVACHRKGGNCPHKRGLVGMAMAKNALFSIQGAICCVLLLN